VREVGACVLAMYLVALGFVRGRGNCESLLSSDMALAIVDHKRCVAVFALM